MGGGSPPPPLKKLEVLQIFQVFQPVGAVGTDGIDGMVALIGAVASLRMVVLLEMSQTDKPDEFPLLDFGYTSPQGAPFRVHKGVQKRDPNVTQFRAENGLPKKCHFFGAPFRAQNGTPK